MPCWLLCDQWMNIPNRAVSNHDMLASLRDASEHRKGKASYTPTIMADLDLASVLPRTADVANDHLTIGRCDTIDLAREFGTPLYVFDEEELRGAIGEYRWAFTSRYENTLVVYASKAYLGRWIAALVAEEGLGMDVVSGGELAVARSVDFPMDKVLFHGNNKSEQELREAVDAGVGRIVVDNFLELATLDRVAGGAGARQPVLLRINPNVDPHTHEKTTTGVIDAKFGFVLEEEGSGGEGDAAEEAVVQAMQADNLELMGLHCHLGSPIFELEPYEQANEIMLAFAAKMRDRHGFALHDYSPGGGFAAPYVREDDPPTADTYAETVIGTMREQLKRHDLPDPLLSVEPGRSIAARAGVALYTVGARKEIPGVRTYVSVDGGMADNIRPALYDARYEALVANRATAAAEENVTIAGKYCESGDLLIRDIDMPRLEAGDLLALPAAGAYCLSMASNYNHAPRPAVVLVKDGNARLVRRRETYEDMMQYDVWEE
jgi:diaminopimelate decarboxylase